MSQDPAVMVGTPVVKGTRIPVERVIQHLAENPDLQDLFAAFPHLTLEDVQACLTYAHERLEVDWKRAKRAQAPRAHSAHEGSPARFSSHPLR
ncbi:MAG: DUF433 domain-containing protein [Thermomicrobiales bacterium]